MLENDIYNKLLKICKIYIIDTDIILEFGLISLDNLHDSIIKNGIDLKAPINFYIQTAKGLALNGNRDFKKRLSILEKNLLKSDFINVDEYDYNIYNFNEIELILVNELINNIPKYKSKIPRRKYDKIFNEIKRKAINI